MKQAGVNMVVSCMDVQGNVSLRKTARFVAGKMRMRDYQRKKVMEVQTNVTLGTGYLKIVLEP